MTTRYVDVAAMQTLIRTIGLPRMLIDIADAIAADFRRWPEFQKSARTANHSPGGVIELMPISDANQFSFKYVNGHPKNGVIGLPTVMAFGVLADVPTGYPILFSEMTLLTAIRTAATSLMAARLLARPDSRRMALIGNGAQAEFQILAFHHGLGITHFRLFDIDPDATEKLLDNLCGYPCLNLSPTRSIDECVANADIITTCTADKAYATILHESMVHPGCHINAVGGDCPGKTELSPAVLDLASVFVEYAPQTRIEGEIQQKNEHFAVTELWEALAGEKPGRTSETEITLFDSVGFALEDYSALRYVNAIAQEHNLGETINLIPPIRDPRNLYGLLTD